jgi:isoaspartyl peptidase/L-asparaginase-like protein (Ntn-hydrolase superfamily)
MARPRVLALAIALAACRHSAGPAPDAAPPPPRAAAIAHGGVGTRAERSAAVAPAVRAALAALAAGADPLDAAVRGVVVLEDDPTFNAGTGSYLRLDGLTVQMDAAVMDSAGRFGAVAAIERVKNPILVARAVAETPHLMLAGEGATAFARRLGHPDHDPTTPRARRKRERAVAKLLGRSDGGLPPGWKGFDWRRYYNFVRPPREAGLGPPDTVGVLVRAADGRFAAALSTGGTALTLRGRVGDVPVYGAGLYAGPHGAVAATGNGEDIVRALLALRVYERMAAGAPPREAVQWGVGLFPQGVEVGIIAIDRREAFAGANRSMASAQAEAR